MRPLLLKGGIFAIYFHPGKSQDGDQGREHRP